MNVLLTLSCPGLASGSKIIFKAGYLTVQSGSNFGIRLAKYPIPIARISINLRPNTVL